MRAILQRLAISVPLLAIIAAAGCGGGVAEQKTKIAFGTGTTAAQELDALSRAVVRAVEEYAPQFDVIPHQSPGGTAEAVRDIARYDFCGLSLDEAAQAYYGFFQFEGQPHSRLRLLCIVGILPISFIVAADAGIESIYGLEGKDFGSGKEDAAQFKAMKLAEALGISPRWNSDPWSNQVDLYERGELVGFLACGAPDSLLVEAATRRPFTILQLPETELDKADRSYSGTGLAFPLCSLRAGTYPAQSDNIATFGLLLGWFAKQGAPAEVAYWVLKAAWLDVWELSASYEPLKLDIIQFPKLTLEYGPFPLHSGAVRFYRELELHVPNRLLPPEMR